MASNFLVILTGKTASGKDTVASRLQIRFPDLKKILTTTSRLPRIGETEGIDYNYITEGDFRQKISEGEFLEHVCYGGNFYGTRKTQITGNLHNNLIWRIDPSRAGQAREFIKNSFDQKTAEDLLKKLVVIYLTVNDEISLERLKKRKLKNEEIERRMYEDRKFWQQHKDNYDFVIENIPGELDQTVDKIVSIIEKRFS